MIELFMQVREDKYKVNSTLPEELVFVEEEQITHEI